MSLHYDSDNNYLFVNRKEIYIFKANNGHVNFLSWFCLGGISNEVYSNDLKEVSFKGNVYDFSVDCNAIDESNTLNNRRYLMIKILNDHKYLMIN